MKNPERSLRQDLEKRLVSRNKMCRWQKIKMIYKHIISIKALRHFQTSLWEYYYNKPQKMLLKYNLRNQINRLLPVFIFYRFHRESKRRITISSSNSSELALITFQVPNKDVQLFAEHRSEYCLKALKCCINGRQILHHYSFNR